MADTRRKRARRQSPKQDIQEFAESTMKEMLSWYGYDRRESSPRLDCSASSPPTAGSAGARGSRPVSPASDMSATPPRALSPVTSSPGAKKTPVVCSWCNKLGSQLYTMGTKSFCSEPCFSQSRVANFRKTKLCDWCKNIRDTLNIEYVNGDEQQLQFCSESCLNAYKMNIFCKETEAHIQMHPQLRSLVAPSAGGPLITPDLWLRERERAAPAQPTAEEDGLRRRQAARRRPPAASSRAGGVRARSNTAPVQELRERARRRPSAPAPAPAAPARPLSLPAATVLLPLPLPVPVPVPVPLPIPVPEQLCRQLLAAAPSAPCPILKRELERESCSGSEPEGLDLSVRRRKPDRPQRIKMEADDCD